MDFVDTQEITGIWSYLGSVDWKDPWILGLMFAHVLLIITTVTTRKRGNIQACLFFVLLLLVYFSENINEVAARHWRRFSRQQYFDSQGTFISLMFSIPLLLNCLLMVCNWLYLSGTLMVKLKRAQLKHRITGRLSCTENIPQKKIQ